MSQKGKSKGERVGKALSFHNSAYGIGYEYQRESKELFSIAVLSEGK